MKDWGDMLLFIGPTIIIKFKLVKCHKFRQKQLDINRPRQSQNLIVSVILVISIHTNSWDRKWTDASSG